MSKYPVPVYLLFGGTSDEYRVSVASSRNIAATIKEARPIFWARTGEVYECDRERLLNFDSPFTKDFDPCGTIISPSLEGFFATIKSSPRPIFIIGLHGGEGEDGTVQRLLEERGFLYTGSDSVASHNAFDKQKSRKIMRQAGGLIAQGEELPSSLSAVEIETRLKNFVKKYTRAVLKPNASGSSFGVSFMQIESNFYEIANRIQGEGIDYLIEEFIEGLEITVGVTDSPHGLIPISTTEVSLAVGRSFDFNAKYLGQGVKEITPARLPPELIEAAKELALLAHRSLRCAGYSRTDMILKDNRFYFLEINTLPGLTNSSFVPQQLADIGVNLETFLDWQLSPLALQADCVGNL
jgi:D-alanine-D-alanine ligase